MKASCSAAGVTGRRNAILELMTRAHGRHLGLVRGGAGSRLRPVLQPGNRVALTWRARLDEHLGQLCGRAARLRAAAAFCRRRMRSTA